MADLLQRLSVVAPSVASDLRAAPRHSRRLGFAGLQLPLRWGETDLTELSGTGQREVRRLLAAEAQTLVSLSVDIGVKGVGPGADVDRALTSLDRALLAARGLSAGTLSLDLGPLPQPKTPDKPEPPRSVGGLEGLILLPTASEIALVARSAAPVPETTDPAFFSQVDAALIEFGRRADRAGVVVALRSDLSTFAALERALKAADCPSFGVDLDPVAMLRDPWPPDEIFSRLGDLLRHVRARDAVGGAAARTRPATIGQGDVSWPDLIGRLHDADFRGWITVDSMELQDRAGGAAEGLAALRRTR